MKFINLKGYSDEKTRFFRKVSNPRGNAPKMLHIMNFHIMNLTFQCYYVKILVFHSIHHFWYFACILIRESLERGVMTSLTQHIARCYFSKQWKICLKAKLRLRLIMVSRLRSYRLTLKNILSHLPVIMKI